MDDTTAQALGFTDADEFFRLVAAPDLSKPGAVARFKTWQSSDATKAGLLSVFPELVREPDA